MPEIVEVQVGDPGGFARIRPAIEASTQTESIPARPVKAWVTQSFTLSEAIPAYVKHHEHRAPASYQNIGRRCG
jgi:hypothetical protein